MNEAKLKTAEEMYWDSEISYGDETMQPVLDLMKQYARQVAEEVKQSCKEQTIADCGCMSGVEGVDIEQFLK